MNFKKGDQYQHKNHPPFEIRKIDNGSITLSRTSVNAYGFRMKIERFEKLVDSGVYTPYNDIEEIEEI